MQENILHDRQAFRDLQLSVREVHDRHIGTFEHNIDSLKANSFAVLTVPNIGDIGLISKARNYSTTQYDIMVSYLTDEVSAIDQIDAQQRGVFFTVLADLHQMLSKESDMQLVIGLNQHPQGFELPERSATGHKTRVQTLKPLHAHIYEVSVASDKTYRMGDLPREDQRDMCDPFLVVSGEVLSHSFEELSIMSQELTLGIAPMGINLRFDMSLDDLLRHHSDLLSAIQNKMQAVYDIWKEVFSSETVEEREKRVEQMLKGNTYSLYSRRILQTLSRALQPESEVKPDEVLVQGLAVTYTLFQDREGKTTISLHPRLMSHGNSADAFGLYVDNKEGEYANELAEKRKLYKKIIGEFSNKYQITEGDFIKNE